MNGGRLCRQLDPGFIAHALGVVARAKGMTQIASQTGLSREQLYRSFSAEGNPTLCTTLAAGVDEGARHRRRSAFE